MVLVYCVVTKLHAVGLIEGEEEEEVMVLVTKSLMIVVVVVVVETTTGSEIATGVPMVVLVETGMTG